jgi:2-amino-4-hydroxy-6-hydroxymethyldihydropteridine diphosphokinase
LRVFLGLGSNVGDRLKYIEDAIERIEKLDGVTLVKKASIYETEPWGVKDQEHFLNTAIEIHTSLSAKDLHKKIKDIEEKLGRENRDRWTSREIDIDLLFYGDEVIDDENLNIPHREIENRKFVLIPLAEIDQDFIHPVLNKPVSVLLRETPDNLEVLIYSANVQEKLGE